MAALKEIRNGGFSNSVYRDVRLWPGSCVNGPIVREHSLRPLYGMVRVEGCRRCRLRRQEPCGYTARYMPGLHRVMPSSAKIQEVLVAMGKTSPDKE